MGPGVVHKGQARLSPTPPLFRRLLLKWYAHAGRHDLPWRRTWSFYHVLVSEFMLQQTTVATVIPYYHRFLKEFPTLHHLAQAPLERVLELWSGLGYYARARNLHAAANKILSDFNGQPPGTAQAVRSLPGVGPYTAGALLSFAFNKPEALVDGNVVRVLSRVYGIRENTKDPKAMQRLWALAWKLVPPAGARHFNSALMDLGALVCRPASPDCLVCPFFKPCWARSHGKQEELPLSSSGKPKKQVHVYVGLVEREGRWALVRRPHKGLYGGLWEFPEESTSDSLWRSERVETELQRRTGLPLRMTESLPTLRHVLTHRDMFVHPCLCSLRGPAPAQAEVGWFSWREIQGMAISSLTRRVLELLRAHGARKGGHAVPQAPARRKPLPRVLDGNQKLLPV